jgi:hypothetical protein
VHVGFDALIQSYSIVCWSEIDMLVFETAPEAFDKDVIDGSAFGVHADASSFVFE